MIRTFSVIFSMRAGSAARFRSASLAVTPKCLVRKSMGVSPPRNSLQFGDKLYRRDAWQKAVGGGFRRHKARKPCDLDRRRSVRLGNRENALRWILRANHRILGLRRQADCSREFAVIHP